MKRALLSCIAMVAVCGIVPGLAAAQLILYDNFESKVLDAGKWTATESSAEGVDILESGRMLKSEPVYGFKGLDIFNRSYADPGSNTGRSGSYSRVLFIDGSAIRTIQAKVVVKKYQATTCATNTDATEPRVRIGGMFFNTGTAIPEDNTNDVFAFIAIGRPTDSTGPANVLTVYGIVSLCTNANCSTTTQIHREEMGTVNKNQKVKVGISWDPVNNQFAFQKGRTVQIWSNTAPVGDPPGTPRGGNKRLEINHLIPNCAGSLRPMSYMEAFFDDIKIETLP